MSEHYYTPQPPSQKKQNIYGPKLFNTYRALFRTTAISENTAFNKGSSRSVFQAPPYNKNTQIVTFGVIHLASTKFLWYQVRVSP